MIRPAPEIEYDWIEDIARAFVNPRANERLALTSGRRYVLAADEDTKLTITSTHTIRSVALTLDDGEWIESKSDKIQPSGATIELTPTRRVALLIGSPDDIGAAAYVMNSGSTPVRVIREDGSQVAKIRPISWSSPSNAGIVAPGREGSVHIDEGQRLLIQTDNSYDIVLSVSNPNSRRGLKVRYGASSLAVIPRATFGSTIQGAAVIAECVSFTVNAKHGASLELEST